MLLFRSSTHVTAIATPHPRCARTDCSQWPKLRRAVCVTADPAATAAGIAGRDGRGGNGKSATNTALKESTLGYLLNSKRMQSEDSVSLENCGRMHVRQVRGRDQYREYLAVLAGGSGVPGLGEVEVALRTETGDATVAYHTIKAAGTPVAAATTFARLERAGFRSQPIPLDAQVRPDPNPSAGARQQRQRVANAPLFDGFVHSIHAVNGPHKENTTEETLKVRTPAPAPAHPHT